MEDWQKILEGRYRNVQDFGEYIGLEITKCHQHPFNLPESIDKKLENAGYKIKDNDRGVRDAHIRVELWKREYVEKAERLEKIERNYSDMEYGTITDLSSVFDDPPLVNSEMAQALLDVLREKIDQLQAKTLLLEDRIESGIYQDELERMPPAYWKRPETLDILK